MVNPFKRFFAKKESVKAAPEVRELIVKTEEIGSSGIKIYGGYVYEDYLDKMRGTERADKFDQMRRSDSNVKMLMSAVKNPIKSANWSIKPGNQDNQKEAEADADFIKHILFKDMGKTFNQFLGEALTMADFGHSVFEITHKVVTNHPKFGNYNGIRNLAWRSPRTIERWNVDPKTEELKSITQIADGDLGKFVDIPAEFLIWFNIEQEGSNYEGVSLLRSCYGNWMRKNNYLKLNAAGIEKYAIPTPIVTVPPSKEDSEEFNRMQLVLQQYTSHQKAYLFKPYGWEIDFSATSSYDPSRVEVSIDNEDKRMSKSFLANFLELGMNGTGAYALSNDLSDFFLSGITHLANEICSKINTKLIPHLIKLNRGERESYPELTVNDISEKAGLELANIFGSLAQNEIIIPDDTLEDHVRERYKLPPRSQDGQRRKAPSFAAFSDDSELAQKVRKVGVRGIGERKKLWAR